MARLEVTRFERKNYPTYRAARRVLNGDMTAPAEFLVWTFLRSIVILPGLALVGVRGWRLPAGALAGSSMVSLFALYRSYATKRAEALGTYRNRRGSPPRLKCGFDDE